MSCTRNRYSIYIPFFINIVCHWTTAYFLNQQFNKITKMWFSILNNRVFFKSTIQLKTKMWFSVLRQKVHNACCKLWNLILKQTYIKGNLKNLDEQLYRKVWVNYFILLDCIFLLVDDSHEPRLNLNTNKESDRNIRVIYFLLFSVKPKCFYFKEKCILW